VKNVPAAKKTVNATPLVTPIDRFNDATRHDATTSRTLPSSSPKRIFH